MSRSLFAHGHLLRVLFVRWLGPPASAGQRFLLDTAILGVLGQCRDMPAVRVWNAILVG